LPPREVLAQKNPDAMIASGLLRQEKAMLVMDPVLEYPERHRMEAALIVVVVHRGS
jgi:hypothetical protein